MNWIKLGPKEPDFNEEVLFINAEGEWWKGELSEKIVDATRTLYKVTFDEVANRSDATHFMRITTPKEK